MSARLKSRLVVFEGIDGCGKSTQAKLLAARLTQESSYQVTLLREPGSTVLGENIRELLGANYGLEATTKLFLYAAARTELVAKVLVPLLAKLGQFIILDRFVWSTLVYQGPYVSGLPRGLADKVATSAIGGGRYDDLVSQTVFIDTPVITCLHRTRIRDGEADVLMGRKGEAARTHYQDLVRAAQPGTCMTLAGNESTEAIAEGIWEVMRTRNIIQINESNHSSAET